MGLSNIVVGWARHLELIKTPAAVQELSKTRMEACSTCPFAKESKALEFINGSAEHIDTIYCTICKCPCHQKSLVDNERCPEGKW